MQTDDEIIEVVVAHKEGKKIQIRKHNDTEWIDLMVAKPLWNFEMVDYRVAPEPRKPREWKLSASMLDAAKMIEGVIHSGEPEIIVREVLE